MQSQTVQPETLGSTVSVASFVNAFKIGRHLFYLKKPHLSSRAAHYPLAGDRPATGQDSQSVGVERRLTHSAWDVYFSRQ